MRTIIAALVAALFLSAPLVASAQVPSYAGSDDGSGGGDAQIRGRIVSFDGAYAVGVQDDKGYTDNVQLHSGTIINPTGLTLAPGMVVSILGYNAGSYFAANEIDTPYTYYSGVPYYSGHPWNYYGPSIGLSFYFGNTGWWHGDAFAGGGYRYQGGVRLYNNVHVNAVYRGGAYQGRAYAAPPERGGYYAHGAPAGAYRGGPSAGRRAPEAQHGGGPRPGGEDHDHR